MKSHFVNLLSNAKSFFKSIKSLQYEFGSECLIIKLINNSVKSLLQTLDTYQVFGPSSHSLQCKKAML